MELFLLYVWLKLDTIHFTCGFIIVLTLIYLLFRAMWATSPSNDRKREMTSQKLSTSIRRCSVTIAVLFITGLVLPTQKETAVLVAGHYALQVIESPEAAKIVGVLRMKANEYLDKELSIKKD